MAAADHQHQRRSIPGSNFVPPVNRLDERHRRYFDRHPEVSPEQFLLQALRREIHLREQCPTGDGDGSRRRIVQEAPVQSAARAPVRAEDIRVHAWLRQRLAKLHHERYGLWPKFRRLLFGNRMAEWLGLELLNPRNSGDIAKPGLTRSSSRTIGARRRPASEGREGKP
jgi:hypothetical protein